VRGWVQCLGRRSIRRVLAAAGEAARSASTFSRFFRSAAWEFADLWRWLIVQVLVPWFAATGRLVFAIDETTCDKFGKRVAFAALFRDPVRSEGGRSVFRRAHCWVVMSLQVRLPLWRKLVSFPVGARLYRKKADCDAAHPFRTCHQLAREMMDEVASWLPDRTIEVVTDGAYPCREFLRDLPANVVVSSRMACRAAVYDLPRPPRVRRRGRPRQKGRRLPSLARMARRVRTWRRVNVLVGDHERVELVWSRLVLWWEVTKAMPVRLVIRRDPEGKHGDLFLFTTDAAAEEAAVLESYGRRPGIEELIREAKQLFGFRLVQGWRPRTVERQAPFALLVLSVVKAWYVHDIGLAEHSVELHPTSAMLTALRFAYWRLRITALRLPERKEAQILQAIQNALSTAA
jgi:hypothetical protein